MNESALFFSGLLILTLGFFMAAIILLLKNFKERREWVLLPSLLTTKQEQEQEVKDYKEYSLPSSTSQPAYPKTKKNKNNKKNKKTRKEKGGQRRSIFGGEDDEEMPTTGVDYESFFNGDNHSLDSIQWSKPGVSLASAGSYLEQEDAMTYKSSGSALVSVSSDAVVVHPSQQQHPTEDGAAASTVSSSFHSSFSKNHKNIPMDAILPVYYQKAKLPINSARLA